MLTVKDILDWGELDVQVLENWLNVAEKFGITLNEIKEELKNDEMDITDINSWYYMTMYLITEAITDEIFEVTEGNEEIMEKANKLTFNFKPYINYADSHFNNILDEIDFAKNKEEIVNEVIKKLRRN